MLDKLFRGTADFAPLVIRIALGIVFIYHGGQKLFGLWGGGGLQGTAQYLAGLGFQPAYAWAVLLAVVEFFGGVLVLVGLFTRYAALVIAIDMVVAIALVHWARPFAVSKGGMEFGLVNLAAALSLLLTGGRVGSLDRAIRRV